MVKTVTDRLANPLGRGANNVMDSAPLWEELFPAE
jgi:hypothetical protein